MLLNLAAHDFSGKEFPASIQLIDIQLHHPTNTFSKALMPRSPEAKICLVIERLLLPSTGVPSDVASIGRRPTC